jgi:hypothetical protein
MKARRIYLSDFSFSFAGYGHYKVGYSSPMTGKTWWKTTNNMPLIDATKNSDNPKQKDLAELKRICKS